MPGEDPNHRFDYLFEPVDGDTVEATDDGAVAQTAVARSRPAPRTKLAIWALVLASAAALIAIVMLVLRPTSDVRTDAPTESKTVPTSQSAEKSALPVATTQPAPRPPEPVVADTPTPTPPAPASASAPVAPAPAPVQTAEPPTVPPLPGAPGMQPPATRAPMSVEPAPRTPFPNQTPDYGSDDRGGLLGGGGLL